MKQKTVIIGGKEISIKDAKKRRDQIDKGFVLGMFDREKHKKSWDELSEILEALRYAK